MNADEIPSTAAEMRALAEQAEAEAAEAEALATAARARAHAIQLRRQAERVEATKEDEVDAEEPLESEVQDLQSEGEPEDSESPDEPEGVETEQSPDDVVAEPPADMSSAGEAAEKPTRYRRWPSPLSRPRWSTVAACLTVVIIPAALAGSGYMIKEHQDAVRQHQRAAEFAAAARQGVVTMTSLDFNEAKQGVQRILDNSTGSFKDEFGKMADDFTKVVQQSKVISRGSVQAAAVDLDTMTNDSAVVLVASTSEITNAAGAKQDPRNYRLIVTVARDGDQLKMSKVEFVP